MDAAYTYFSKDIKKKAKDVQKTQNKIRELQIQYFQDTSPYGNLLLGYDFTIRGKKQRGIPERQVFARRDVSSVLQMVLFDKNPNQNFIQYAEKNKQKIQQ